MYLPFYQALQKELDNIQSAGLFKKERIITSAQGAEVTISTGEKVLIFCANNYLGLSAHPKVIEAAKATIDTHGFGMSSVRFICGTQDIHKTLESKIAEFLRGLMDAGVIYDEISIEKPTLEDYFLQTAGNYENT